MTVAPSIWFTGRVTAARPSASIGWRTVVNGGSVQFMNAESSKPTTEMSAGTPRPARRAARMAPEGQRVASADDPGDAVAQHAARRGVPAFQREQRVLDLLRRDLRLLHRASGAPGRKPNVSGPRPAGSALFPGS
jgi:hypothetical protein